MESKQGGAFWEARTATADRRYKLKLARMAVFFFIGSPDGLGIHRRRSEEWLPSAAR
jgi:hypothetical protein